MALDPRSSETVPRSGCSPSGTRTELRRSLLFVPGGELRMLERSDSVGADTLVFDLEDSVEPRLEGAGASSRRRAAGSGHG